MSKSQQQSTYNNAGQQQQANNNNESAVATQLQGVLGPSQANASNLYPAITGGYGQIASTGGYDPGALSTITNTATNLATTGGFSPDQVTAIKDENTAAAQSTFQTGEAAAQRMAATTGGYGNNGAVVESLARQGSNAGAAAAQNATATLAPTIQAGEIAGTNILGSTEENIAGNKLSALSGSTNIYGLNEAQTTATINQILQNYQQTGQLNNQDLSILSGLATQPGVFDKIVGTLGTLGGAAGGILKGING